MLTQRCHEYRMSPGDTMVQHLAKVQNMAACLKDVGEKVSDVTLMAKLLGSLSSKYAMLQTVWDSGDPEKQTLNNLVERLIRQESRFTAEDEVPGAFSVYKKDNYAKKSGKSNQKEKRYQQKTKDPREVECFKCREKGHFARECKNERREKVKQNEERRCCSEARVWVFGIFSCSGRGSVSRRQAGCVAY